MRNACEWFEKRVGDGGSEVEEWGKAATFPREGESEGRESD